MIKVLKLSLNIWVIPLYVYSPYIQAHKHNILSHCYLKKCKHIVGGETLKSKLVEGQMSFIHNVSDIMIRDLRSF